MTKELIAQWVIDNRYVKSENNKVSDSEMYHKLVDEIESLIKNLGDIGDVSECVLYSDGSNMQYKGDVNLTIVLEGEFKGISLKQLGKGSITVEMPSDR